MGLAAARYAAKARGKAGVIWFMGYNARNDEIHENIEPSEFNYERKYRWRGTPLSRSEAARASPPAFR